MGIYIRVQEYDEYHSPIASVSMTYGKHQFIRTTIAKWHGGFIFVKGQDPLDERFYFDEERGNKSVFAWMRAEDDGGDEAEGLNAEICVELADICNQYLTFLRTLTSDKDFDDNYIQLITELHHVFFIGGTSKKGIKMG